MGPQPSSSLYLQRSSPSLLYADLVTLKQFWDPDFPKQVLSNLSPASSCLSLSPPPYKAFTFKGLLVPVWGRRGSALAILAPRHQRPRIGVAGPPGIGPPLDVGSGQAGMRECRLSHS